MDKLVIVIGVVGLVIILGMILLKNMYSCFTGGNEGFELTQHPCLSRQLKLLNRVGVLLVDRPNDVQLQKIQWILWHGNLTTAELNDIEKQLP